MKPKFLFPLLVLFVLPLTSYAVTETYKLDPSHTYIVWNISHLGFSTQSGKFADIDGTIILDDTKPEDSKVTVTIKPAEVVTGVPKLDDHLKAKDFFDVSKYPTATFVSDKITVTGKDRAKVYGTLTLLGVSKPLVLDVTLNKQGMNPMTNKKTLGFSAKASLKRSDFGMKYALPAVGDDVEMDIGAEATLEKPTNN